MASLVLSHFGCSGESYIRIVQSAGNTSSHTDRFILLSGLRDSGKVPQSYLKDLEIILPHARQWALDSQSASKMEDGSARKRYLHYYFSNRIREKLLIPDRTDEVQESSPLYPLYCLYGGLALTYHTIQISDIRLVPPEREIWYGKGRELIGIAHKEYPGNETLGIYFNEPVAWPEINPPEPTAPAWANAQRESLLKLQQVIHWWIDNRQLEDGTYGGGLNDDCEMWRMWKSIMIGYEDPKTIEAQEKLTRVTLDRPEMELGYTSRLTDVEHSSEETSDVITPMMHLHPENPEWANWVKKIFRLAKEKWSGYNEKGLLQFKSSYISSTEIDMAPHRTADTFYHFRLMQPILLYWQRTGDKEMGDWILEWLYTWTEAAMSSERGKPGGIIPTAIHWPDGRPGGINDQWWKPGNYSSPIYDWPKRLYTVMDSLVLAYHKTGERKYLEPLFESTRIRREYLARYGTPSNPSGPGPENWEPGSLEWCASQLGEMVTVALMKYRNISGDTSYDDFLSSDANGFGNFQLTGNSERFEQELDYLADAFRFNKEVYTGEVRHTDRVFAFPDYYLNYFYEAASARMLAGLLHQSVTGDPGHYSYFPLEAISWKTDVGDLASVVLINKKEHLKIQVFNFTDKFTFRIKTKMLIPGNYSLEIRDLSSGEIRRSSVEIEGYGTVVDLPLFPGREQLIRLKM